MLNCLTALEARAIAYLVTPEDWSLYTHIEVRIKDAVQNGGTHILYGGTFNTHIIDALRALGYEVVIMQFEGKPKMIRIDWTRIMCPDSLVCPKEVKRK